MGRAYSVDLRDRVNRYIGLGHTRREAAARFGVSVSFAVKLVQRAVATGSTVPARQGRPPGAGKLAAHIGRLTRWVEAQPDITMPELAAKLLARTGLEAHPASLSRALIVAGFSFKKNTTGIGIRTR